MHVVNVDDDDADDDDDDDSPENRTAPPDTLFHYRLIGNWVIYITLCHGNSQQSHVLSHSTRACKTVPGNDITSITVVIQYKNTNGTRVIQCNTEYIDRLKNEIEKIENKGYFLPSDSYPNDRLYRPGGKIYHIDVFYALRGDM